MPVVIKRTLPCHYDYDHNAAVNEIVDISTADEEALEAPLDVTAVEWESISGEHAMDVDCVDLTDVSKAANFDAVIMEVQSEDDDICDLFNEEELYFSNQSIAPAQRILKSTTSPSESESSILGISFLTQSQAEPTGAVEVKKRRITPTKVDVESPSGESKHGNELKAFDVVNEFVSPLVQVHVDKNVQVEKKEKKRIVPTLVAVDSCALNPAAQSSSSSMSTSSLMQ